MNSRGHFPSICALLKRAIALHQLCIIKRPAAEQKRVGRVCVCIGGGLRSCGRVDVEPRYARGLRNKTTVSNVDVFLEIDGGPRAIMHMMFDHAIAHTKVCGRTTPHLMQLLCIENCVYTVCNCAP